jgi:glycosyltransferase involved in cell wall biosynthesis
LNIIEKIKDRRVKVIDGKTNMGLAARLNQGVEVARGDYIARMDADDISYRDRLLIQSEFLDKNKDIDLLSCKIVEIDLNDNYKLTRQFLENDSEIKGRPWKGFLMPHPSWMGRRKGFEENTYKIPAPFCSEDQELLLRAHRISKYYSLPNVLMAYRVGGKFNFRKRFFTRLSILRYSMNYFWSISSYKGVFFTLVYFFGRFLKDYYDDTILSKSRENFNKDHEVQCVAELLSIKD